MDRLRSVGTPLTRAAPSPCPLGRWIDGKVEPCLRLLTVATVVFRAELLLLLAPLILSMLARRQIGFLRLVGLGITTGAAALAATLLVDSVLWRRALWPELEARPMTPPRPPPCLHPE